MFELTVNLLTVIATATIIVTIMWVEYGTGIAQSV